MDHRNRRLIRRLRLLAQQLKQREGAGKIDRIVLANAVIVNQIDVMAKLIFDQGPQPILINQVIHQTSIFRGFAREYRFVDRGFDILPRQIAMCGDAVNDLSVERIDELVQFAAQFIAWRGAGVGFFSTLVFTDLNVVGIHPDFFKEPLVKHRFKPDAGHHHLTATQNADVGCARGGGVSGGVVCIRIHKRAFSRPAKFIQRAANFLCLRKAEAGVAEGDEHRAEFFVIAGLMQPFHQVVNRQDIPVAEKRKRGRPLNDRLIQIEMGHLE